MFLSPVSDDYGYGVIKKNNQSFVPLRYLTDQLDAEVKWSKGSKKITVINDLTGEEIVLTVGSKTASVGGKTVTAGSSIRSYQRIYLRSAPVYGRSARCDASPGGRWLDFD